MEIKIRSMGRKVVRSSMSVKGRIGRGKGLDLKKRKGEKGKEKKGKGKKEYNIQEGIEIESNYTQN